jgi:hypothetical protein
MKIPKRYAIIYTVAGHRHRHLSDFTSLTAARYHLTLMRRGGWHAWIEEQPRTHRALPTK